MFAQHSYFKSYVVMCYRVGFDAICNDPRKGMHAMFFKRKVHLREVSTNLEL
jgi:hypothetical protein